MKGHSLASSAALPLRVCVLDVSNTSVCVCVCMCVQSINGIHSEDPDVLVEAQRVRKAMANYQVRRRYTCVPLPRHPHHTEHGSALPAARVVVCLNSCASSENSGLSTAAIL